MGKLPVFASAHKLTARSIPVAVLFLVAACSAAQPLSPGQSGPFEAQPNGWSAQAGAAAKTPDPRNAARINGTWDLLYTVTKVENVTFAYVAGEAAGGDRWTFTHRCPTGPCDVDGTVFDFIDGETGERTLAYKDDAYAYTSPATSGAGECNVDAKTFSKAFEHSTARELRPSGVTPDGRGAAELSGVAIQTAKAIGAAAAAGCLGWSVSYAIKGVRSTAVSTPVHQTEPELQVIRSVGSGSPWDSDPGQGNSTANVSIVVEVKNVSSSPVRFSLGSTFTLHKASDGSNLFEGSLFFYPEVLEPGEFGYLIGRGGVVDRGGRAAQQVGYVSTKVLSAKASAPGLRLATANVKWTVTTATRGDSVHATGTIINASSKPAYAAWVGIIFFDAAGALLGSVDVITPGPIPAGESRPFNTQHALSGVPPDLAGDIATAKVFAYALAQ